MTNGKDLAGTFQNHQLNQMADDVVEFSAAGVYVKTNNDGLGLDKLGHAYRPLVYDFNSDGKTDIMAFTSDGFEVWDAELSAKLYTVVLPDGGTWVGQPSFVGTIVMNSALSYSSPPETTYGTRFWALVKGSYQWCTDHGFPSAVCTIAGSQTYPVFALGAAIMNRDEGANIVISPQATITLPDYYNGTGGGVAGIMKVGSTYHLVMLRYGNGDFNVVVNSDLTDNGNGWGTFQYSGGVACFGTTCFMKDDTQHFFKFTYINSTSSDMAILANFAPNDPIAQQEFYQDTVPIFLSTAQGDVPTVVMFQGLVPPSGKQGVYACSIDLDNCVYTSPSGQDQNHSMYTQLVGGKPTTVSSPNNGFTQMARVYAVERTAPDIGYPSHALTTFKVFYNPTTNTPAFDATGTNTGVDTYRSTIATSSGGTYPTCLSDIALASCGDTETKCSGILYQDPLVCNVASGCTWLGGINGACISSDPIEGVLVPTHWTSGTVTNQVQSAPTLNFQYNQIASTQAPFVDKGYLTSQFATGACSEGICYAFSGSDSGPDMGCHMGYHYEFMVYQQTTPTSSWSAKMPPEAMLNRSLSRIGGQAYCNSYNRNYYVTDTPLAAGSIGGDAYVVVGKAHPTTGATSNSVEVWRFNHVTNAWSMIRSFSSSLVQYSLAQYGPAQLMTCDYKLCKFFLPYGKANGGSSNGVITIPSSGSTAYFKYPTSGVTIFCGTYPYATGMEVYGYAETSDAAYFAVKNSACSYIVGYSNSAPTNPQFVAGTNEKEVYYLGLYGDPAFGSRLSYALVPGDNELATPAYSVYNNSKGTSGRAPVYDSGTVSIDHQKVDTQCAPYPTQYNRANSYVDVQTFLYHVDAWGQNPSYAAPEGYQATIRANVFHSVAGACGTGSGTLTGNSYNVESHYSIGGVDSEGRPFVSYLTDLTPWSSISASYSRGIETIISPAGIYFPHLVNMTEMNSWPTSGTNPGSATTATPCTSLSSGTSGPGCRPYLNYNQGVYASALQTGSYLSGSTMSGDASKANILLGFSQPPSQLTRAILSSSGQTVAQTSDYTDYACWSDGGTPTSRRRVAMRAVYEDSCPSGVVATSTDGDNFDEAISPTGVHSTTRGTLKTFAMYDSASVVEAVDLLPDTYTDYILIGPTILKTLVSAPREVVSCGGELSADSLTCSYDPSTGTIKTVVNGLVARNCLPTQTLFIGNLYDASGKSVDQFSNVVATGTFKNFLEGTYSAIVRITDRVNGDSLEVNCTGIKVTYVNIPTVTKDNICNLGIRSFAGRKRCNSGSCGSDRCNAFTHMCGHRDCRECECEGRRADYCFFDRSVCVR
jgi:hypothetical protein